MRKPLWGSSSCTKALVPSCGETLFMRKPLIWESPSCERPNQSGK